ncbi:tellurite resistance TerB family protein [Oleisolibacter albus]|uniref:tellurite resistance TerB family protein n=1 Tax=Oleisolibacter albus TaxID=2171757 RepID=UPI000DF11C4B|nr:DUF533 domain-containing protein [Oleisolibacter albus]
MDVERLVGVLLQSGLSRKGMGQAARRAAFSKDGLMLLAGIGIAAYEHFRGRPPGAAAAEPAAQAGGVPPPFPGAAAVPPPFPGVPPGRAVPAELLLLAMVTAAKADGTLDAAERAALLDHLDRAGAGPAERAALERMLAAPADPDGLVAQVRDRATAVEVYAASRLAIDPDTPAEQAYLVRLAGRLGLDADAVAEIEARLAEAGAV